MDETPKSGSWRSPTSAGRLRHRPIIIRFKIATIMMEMLVKRVHASTVSISVRYASIAAQSD
jgi:hypothetical protein